MLSKNESNMPLHLIPQSELQELMAD